ncbi:MAG: NUDIX hydrolase [Candidatus Synoicihabitans palmerolidicus]|nr:NUDIX hydrolase [Candidatus Synoicihabitans palmerolidicus]
MELPGGILNDGESPMAGAQRKLKEECDVTGGKWELLKSFWPNPARQTNTFHCFLAKGVEQTPLHLMRTRIWKSTS